ncbi:MAG: beta-N-acetylhexosaminidase [Bdellovibrionales bacterium]
MSNTLRKKIGQQMIIGVQGTSLSQEEKQFILSNNIGGVVLFSRNIEDPKQLHALCSEIQSLHHQSIDKAPLFISIDMEGGRVARLKAPFTQWPPLKNLGDIDSPSLSFKFAQAMGEELRAVGINLDFAPCTDVLTNEKNILIGDRSLGSDPELVGRNASAIVRGYLKSDIIACTKHFPGHGNNVIDSHEDLPVEDLDLDRLNDLELIPFKKSFRARCDMVMTAHMLFKNIDPDWPVTLSEKFLKGILRDIGFKKLIITDDLDMKALTNNYDKAFIPVKALQAGANVLLYCNEADSHIQCVDSVEKAVKDGELDEATLDYNKKLVLDVKSKRIKNPDPVDFEEATKKIGHPDHLQLSKAIRDKELPPDIAT